MKKLFLLIILVVLIPELRAQIAPDSLELLYNHNSISNLSTKFDKQLNTYFLNSVFNYNYDKDITIQVYENYKSSLIKQSEKNIRDEHFFSLEVFYPFLKTAGLGFRANNNILSDNRKIRINSSTITDGIIFLNYFPNDNIQLIPFAGVINNKQIGRSDNGALLGFEGNSTNFSTDDFKIIANIKYRNENILPRHNIISNFNLQFRNQFNPNISNEFLAKYDQNKKDFYYEADSLTSLFFNIQENLQSRNEIAYLLQNRLQYKKFADLFDFELVGKFLYRDIDRSTKYKLLQQANSSIFDTRINELNINFEGTIAYNSEKFNSNIRLSYGERDEKNLTKNISSVNNSLFLERSKLESGKNNTGIKSTLSVSGDYLFTNTQILNFSLFQNKLVYNTPSNENYDDRDELITMAKIKYSNKISPYFEAYTSIEGTLNHIIYIYSQKSSNNNINRTLKLSSGGDYNTKNLSSLNIFEVSANYTVYDFEDLVSGIRSFSYRQFFYTDSTRLSLNSNLDILFNGYLKLSEQGDLKWKSFSTKPFRYLEEIFSEPKIRIRFNELSIFAGIRIFSLNTYKYLADKTKAKDTRYLSRGPVFNIAYNIKSSLIFMLNSWYEFIESEDNINKEQTNLNLQINWTF